VSRFEFRLPDVGEGTIEAEIATWHVSIGAHIDEDKPLVDVMTDKATVEITSPVTGTVVALHGEVGTRVPVGDILVVIQKTTAGEVSRHPPIPPVAEITPAAGLAAPPPTTHDPVPNYLLNTGRSQAPLASPSTRRRARELGMELETVEGSGAGGRITRSDLEVDRANATLERSIDTTPKELITETKVIGIRRQIAEKMAESTRRIPHFTYVEELDLTELEKLRKSLNGDRDDAKPRLTLLPFLMRALVRVLRDFPLVNSRYDDDAQILRSHGAVHIGIATQTATGLMVPVIRHAELLSLWECAAEIMRVSAAARAGKATRTELSGSTITLTSLGALGGVAATPIINHPEVAIVGPNKLVEKPVVVNGNVVVRTMMNLSSSFDHRIIDGYEAARFIQSFKRLMETPALIFLDPN
jgi:2-oxoisovalerate dehydrogenase E2 component (dihydrolipoyl transacylase)